MKKIRYTAALLPILLATSTGMALAQTDTESRGESQTAPAPKTEGLPLPGATNPTKHDGTEKNSLSLSAFEQDPKGESQTVKSFVVETSISTHARIIDSQSALRRATDPKVKALAQKLIADDNAMLKSLSDLARRKKVKAPDKVDATRQATIDSLAKLSGTDFDKAYVKQIVNDLESAIGFFNRLIDGTKGDTKKSTKDVDIKAFIDQSLPVLKTNVDMAKTLDGVPTQ